MSFINLKSVFPTVQKISLQIRILLLALYLLPLILTLFFLNLVVLILVEQHGQKVLSVFRNLSQVLQNLNPLA